MGQVKPHLVAGTGGRVIKSMFVNDLWQRNRCKLQCNTSEELPWWEEEESCGGSEKLRPYRADTSDDGDGDANQRQETPHAARRQHVRRCRQQHVLQLQLPATGVMCCTCRYPATRLSCLSHCALKYPTNYDMLCRIFEQLSALPFSVCGNSVRLQSRNFLISWTASCCPLSTCPTA